MLSWDIGVARYSWDEQIQMYSSIYVIFGSVNIKASYNENRYFLLYIYMCVYLRLCLLQWQTMWFKNGNI